MSNITHLVSLAVGLALGAAGYAAAYTGTATEPESPASHAQGDTIPAPFSHKREAIESNSPPPRSTPRPKRQARTSPSSQEDGLDAVQSDVDRLEDELQAAKHGKIQMWPALVPGAEIYHPEQFEQNLNDIIESCGLKMQEMSLNCDEPPCIVAIRGPKNFNKWQDLMACEEWGAKGYPLDGMVMESQIECESGKKEPIYFISPYWREFLEEPGKKDERMTRTEKRWGEIYPTMCNEDS